LFERAGIVCISEQNTSTNNAGLADEDLGIKFGPDEFDLNTS